MRFTVLASGSRGNATLLQSGGFGLLIDAGLTAKELTARLEKAGLQWESVHAVILTHTHGDHWNDSVLSLCLRRSIILHCHEEHARILEKFSRAFPRLRDAGLVQEMPTDTEFFPSAGLRCLPVPVRHDSGATFAFRIEGEADLFGNPTVIGYASDLGCWDDVVADVMADAHLLAIEFNHDVVMQRSSRRPYRLIARVLGNDGHLSNEQGTALVQAVLDRSEPDRLQHVVMLHLSQQCNRPGLATDVARAGLLDRSSLAKVHAAPQDQPLRSIQVSATGGSSRKRARSARRTGESAAKAVQPWLPGLEME